MKRLLCLLMLLSIFLSGCTRTENKEDQVHLNLERSYFSDFFVKEELVEIRCYLCIENPTPKDVQVIVIATFNADQKAGLLKERRIAGVLAEQPDQVVLTIPPGGAELYVNFYGTYDGLPKKQNRLLPDLELITIQPAPVQQP
ncbi:MAG: hypothetical protein E7459_01340 [Ruminococcaceae bacterium]|nr:hypothetical protein [Oscillospiraceae bacterium]